MSQITDWEPLDQETSTAQEPEGHLINSNTEYRVHIRKLEKSLSDTEVLHAKALAQIRKSYEDTFKCFKADVIVTLKALELCAIASQRHGEIALNHHVRDMRLEHLQAIITNAITDFSDRKLTSYEDDF